MTNSKLNIDQWRDISPQMLQFIAIYSISLEANILMRLSYYLEIKIGTELYISSRLNNSHKI